MKLLSLCVFLAGIIAISSRQIAINSKEVHDGIYVRIDDILKHFKKDSLTDLLVDGNKLNLEFLGEHKKVPVIVIDDNGSTKLEHDATHQVFHDKQNDATFTLSTFTLKDGKIVKTIRGSILRDGHEVVVEPAHPPHLHKRQVGDEHHHVKVFRRDLDRRPENRALNLEFVRHQAKRQTTGPLNAYVETLAICDFYCYNQHAAYTGSTVKETIAHHIEGYLAHIMNLADLHYQRSFATDTQLKVGLYVSSYVILTSSEASKFSTDPSVFMTVNGASKDATNRQYVNGDVSLNSFNQWLVAQVAGGLVPATDLAVAFTNSNLFTPSADLLGIAPMGGTCSSGRNGVLVEDNGSFASGGTTAHEVAHNLGVEHDANLNNPACTDDHNYLMSTSNKLTNRLNSYVFSTCSINLLKDNYLNKKLFQCTTNTATRAADYLKFISFKPGQIYSAPEQCKQQYGPNSKLMTGNKSGGGTFQDDMCATLWCTNDFRSASTSAAAAEGTSCGDGKWCIKGVCTADAAAPKGTCLSEDDTTFCNSFTSQYGLANTCLNYKAGPCCKVCGGTLIQKLYTTSTWLSGNTLDNVKFVNAAYVPPCVDKYTWCAAQISAWKTQGYPAICNGGYQVNGEPVESICRQTCALC